MSDRCYIDELASRWKETIALSEDLQSSLHELAAAVELTDVPEAMSALAKSCCQKRDELLASWIINQGRVHWFVTSSDRFNDPFAAMETLVHPTIPEGEDSDTRAAVGDVLRCAPLPHKHKIVTVTKLDDTLTFLFRTCPCITCTYATTELEWDSYFSRRREPCVSPVASALSDDVVKVLDSLPMPSRLALVGAQADVDAEMGLESEARTRLALYRRDLAKVERAWGRDTAVWVPASCLADFRGTLYSVADRQMLGLEGRRQ